MKTQNGFTLLEALIAGIILFAVIASMTSLYQGALSALFKSQVAVERSAAVPFILDSIRVDLRLEGKRSGEGVLQGVSYRWQAKLFKAGTADIPAGLEQEYSPKPDRFKVWRVTLWLEERPPMEFKEISW